jgi:hypothetical protein
MGRACSTHGNVRRRRRRRKKKKKNTCWILVGKSEGKRPLESLGRRWEDNIKIDPGEISWDFID